MYRPSVVGHCYVGYEQILANIEHSTSLGLKVIEGLDAVVEGPLAVVGGGPSVLGHLDALKEWVGEIWAINGTHAWLSEHGIESVLFSVDPGELLAKLAVGAKKAILASHCDPEVFAVLKDADVTIFHSEHAPGAKKPLTGGSTSATRVPMVALMQGFREVHFFGCEGSFDEQSHAYRDEAHEKQLVIRAGDTDYRTTLQFMVQSENLAHLIRKLPHILKDRSGGLLGGMIAHHDTWEVIALSEALKDVLDPDSSLGPHPFVQGASYA